MKLETALKRILESDHSDTVKMYKLWSLAAKQIPGSKAQEIVKNHWRAYQDKVKAQEVQT